MLQIHKASAGSGKTFTLTRQYLKLLLAQRGADGRFSLRPLTPHGHHQPKVHGRILAVTFTNKATDEMTARIIGELAALGGTAPDGRKSPYEDEFIKEFGTDAATLAMHARRALADVLYNFSWFNVSTIDSFFQRVLNTFTRELELSPTHDVEIDDRYPVAVAVGKMLQDINNPDEGTATHRRHLEEWLRRYMLSKLESGGNANLLSRSSSVNERLISEMRGFLNETYKINRAEIDEYFTDPSRIERFSQALGSRGPLAREAQDIMALAAATLERMGEYGQKNVRAPLADFAAGNFGRNRTATWQKAVADPTTAFRKTDKPDAAMLGEVGAALSAIDNFIDKARLARLLFDNVYQLGLFGQVHRYLDEYRHEHDALLLSDTNDLLHRIISEDETPFIYERMGTAIHHFLIDEFQDTSQMQWENLKPLVLESLSRGNDNLIIGDEKQCIYRFRNSDPRLLESKVETLVHGRFPDSVEVHGIDIAENTNWRSSVEVVKFNNTVFNALARIADTSAAHSIEHTYGGLVQQIPQKHADLRGYVKITFFPRAAASSGEEQEENVPLAQRQLDALTAEVSRQLSAGYRPSDIAVLVRKGSEGRRIIEHLMQAMTNPSTWPHGQVPVASADSMPVSMSPAVRMIVNVLRLATEPLTVTKGDGKVDTDGNPVNVVNPVYRRNRLLHRFELSRFEMVEETDENGSPLLNPDGSPRMRRLTDSEALARAVAATSVPVDETTDALQAEIDAELARLRNMESPTLLALTERIIGRFVTPEARRHENNFITAFQDLVADFSERGNNSVLDFLDWWDRGGALTNVPAPDGVEAINVLTIHKAKGLEYACVHLPFCSYDMVTNHSDKRPSRRWYRLDPTQLPFVDPADVPPMMMLPNNTANRDIPMLARQTDEWITEQKVDTLNVAYVAFTRAVRELAVYSEMPSASENAADTRPFNSLLLQALRDMSAQHMEHLGITPEVRQWMTPLDTGLQPCTDGIPDDGIRFTLGTPTAPEPQAGSGGIRPAPEQKVTDAIDYGTLLDEYEVNERSAILAEMDFDELDNFDFDTDRHRGIFLHSVLGQVRRLSDLPKALARQGHRFRLSAEQLQMSRDILDKALADPRVRPWFEGFASVANERSIAGGETLRRPDRIVWMPDGSVAVIDYKFGAADRPAYHSQVRRYLRMLADAGHPGARGYLWFPIKGEIIEVRP